MGACGKCKNEIVEYLVLPTKVFDEEEGDEYSFKAFTVRPNDRTVFCLWTYCGVIGILDLRTEQFNSRFVPTAKYTSYI